MKDVKERVKRALEECEEFGSYDIVDVECYICEREDRELNRLCKEVLRVGGLKSWLEKYSDKEHGRAGDRVKKGTGTKLVKCAGEDADAGAGAGAGIKSVDISGCIKGVDKITSRVINEVLIKVFSEVKVVKNSRELLNLLRGLLGKLITERDRELLKDGKTERWEKVVLWELYRLRKGGRVVRDGGGYRWVE